MVVDSRSQVTRFRRENRSVAETPELETRRAVGNPLQERLSLPYSPDRPRGIKQVRNGGFAGTRRSVLALVVRHYPLFAKRFDVPADGRLRGVEPVSELGSREPVGVPENVEHRYLAVLPTPVLRALYTVHPWAPIVVIDTLLGGGFYLLGIAFVGTG